MPHQHNRWQRGAVLLAGLCVATALAGCAAGSPLTIDLTASKDVLTPDVRGDRLDLTYRVSRPSNLSVSIVSRSGSTYALRSDEPRRPNETYVYPFDGAVPESLDSPRRRVLDDGPYELVLAAADSTGQKAERRQAIEVRGADTQSPAIENLAAFPPSISPN